MSIFPIPLPQGSEFIAGAHLVISTWVAVFSLVMMGGLLVLWKSRHKPTHRETWREQYKEPQNIVILFGGTALVCHVLGAYTILVVIIACVYLYIKLGKPVEEA
jgi:hypothetical protein